MRYAVVHRTSYSYDHEVSVSHHVARLAPRATPCQRVLAHALAVEPAPRAPSRHDDYFGNPTALFSVEGAHRELHVVARSLVEVDPPAPLPEDAAPPWEAARAALPADPDAAEFRFRSPLIPLRDDLAAYARAAFTPARPLLDALLDLTARIHTDFAFDPRATTVTTPVERVFQQRRGVCQDFAHLQIACLRALGLAARYVSGYLETRPPPGQPKLAGADASHAWVQVHLGRAGWIDLDPTNNQVAGQHHIVLGWGRDFSDVSPLRGVLVGSGRHRLQVAVDVTPVAADPNPDPPPPEPRRPAA